MTKITAAEVNRLRQQTGSGMMDCKKALVEAEGDFEKAVEILRKKGQKVAAKRGDRETSEGLVIAKASEDGKNGIIVVVACETDFVAKNQDFVDFANTIANAALESMPENADALQALPYAGNGMTIGEKITEQVGKIGEKIHIADYGVIRSESVVAYNHPGNQVASMVGLSKAAFADHGKDVAMQIAAMRPIAIDKDQVPQDVVDKEIEIGKEQARQEGKPEQILEKIALGKLNKFYKENTLLNQDFIKDNKRSVGQYLKDADGELPVTDFKRFSLAD
ncbi:MAG: translation elongation factor Ts [Bacteroidota bacterium]